MGGGWFFFSLERTIYSSRRTDLPIGGKTSPNFNGRGVFVEIDRKADGRPFVKGIFFLAGPNFKVFPCKAIERRRK